jgi:hypothetical protein
VEKAQLLAAAVMCLGPVTDAELAEEFRAAGSDSNRAKWAVRSIGGIWQRGVWKFPESSN